MERKRQVEVLVQVPAGGFVKRRSDGEIDFVAPLPCPFNYGELPGTLGGDGDPLDAVVLGPRVRRGTLVSTQVYGAIAFEDAGAPDLKLVCGHKPPSNLERASVRAWFVGYGIAKGALNRLRGKSKRTRSAGWIGPDEAWARVAQSKGRASNAGPASVRKETDD